MKKQKCITVTENQDHDAFGQVYCQVSSVLFANEPGSIYT